MREHRWWLDDLISVLACVIILGMSAVAALTSSVKMGYEINTGIFCGLFCLAPIALKHLNILRLPPIFNVMIVAAIFFHAYGVLLLRYDYLVYYDTLTHTLSSMVVALCVYYTMMCYHVLNGKVNFTGKWLPVFIAIIMLGFSAYWEVFEYIVDISFGTNMQYSPFDTLRDLMCNTFGSLVVSVSVAAYMRKHTPKEVVDSFRLNPKLQKFIADPFNERDK